MVGNPEGANRPVSRVNVRLLSWLAIAGSVLGILYAPFHAAAYLATEDGSADAESVILPWAEPFRELVGGALTFGTPDEVYRTYGKVTWLVVAGFVCGILALHARQASPERRAERVGFRIVVVAQSVLALSALVEYYTPFLDEGFLFLAIPGLLGSLVGYFAFGVSTLRAGFVPKAWAWTLLLGMPAMVPLIALLGHIPMSFLVLEVAWIGVAAHLLRTDRAGAHAEGTAVSS